MLQGVRESRCYLLLLTKGVFQSQFVLAELRAAVNAGARFALVHEGDTNTPGWAPFDHYIETSPPDFPGGAKLFRDHESLRYERECYKADSFYTKLIARMEGRG